MKRGLRAALAALSAGLFGCGPVTAPCRMLVPVLTVGSTPGSSEHIACCGSAKQYAVTQSANAVALGVSLQAVATENGGPITGLRLSVVIEHCNAVASGDCMAVAEQTTPNVPAGAYLNPPYPESQAHPSVSGRNTRLALTVANKQSTPGAFYLSVSEVTPGPVCPSL